MKRFGHILAILASFLALAPAFATVAQACTCDRPILHFDGDRNDEAALMAYSDKWYLEASRRLLSNPKLHVYVGSFLKAEVVNASVGRGLFETLDMKGSLRVIEVWRGRTQPRLAIYGQSSSASSCGVPMDVGGHGYVFVLEESDGRIVLADQCTYSILRKILHYGPGFAPKDILETLFNRANPIAKFPLF